MSERIDSLFLFDTYRQERKKREELNKYDQKKRKKIIIKVVMVAQDEQMK
jgi:hypothetical protein